MTPKQSLTGSFLYRPSNDRNQVDITYRDFDVNNNLLQTQIREDRERETERMVEGDLHWEKNYEKKGHKWSADLQFQDEKDHERSDINQYNLGENENLIQRVSNIEDEENFMLQTDYVRPLTEDRGFEVGSRLRFRNIRNDYMVEEQNDQGNFIELPDFTNNFLYTENVYAGYGIYKDDIGEKITYQGGLRLEYTGIITELLSEDEPNQRDYLNLFPSASMTYEFNPLSDLQVSYSRRIDRPNFWSLLPFFSFSDNRVFFSGNPDLNPEFADSYELGYMRYWEKASLYSGLYYRHTMGKTERITTVDSNGFTTIFPINLSVEDAYGFEFNYQHDLTNWWSINANINLFHSVSTGNYDGVNYAANTFSSSGRVNSQVEFWKSKLQASFNFRGPRQTAQGRNLGIYSMNLGWSKDLLNEKATISLSVQDVFNSRKRRSYTNGPGFESYSEFQWRQRQINLSFTYRLNQNKSRKPASRGSSDMGDDDF
ncbi:MAG: outer membrane beta-barrel family protein [Owenweeksia sp.]|nr:outer membrane beta-barrel family protein [Owenweeksia sp.]